MRFTYSEMWWFTSRELRVAFVLMFLARLAYLSVLSVSSKDDEAPLIFVCEEFQFYFRAGGAEKLEVVKQGCDDRRRAQGLEYRDFDIVWMAKWLALLE